MEYKIDDLIKSVEIEADNREKGTAMRGAMSDDGAGYLREQVKFYKMGMDGVYPREWEKYTKHIDEEYQEYLRLKNKFKEL